jgi:hypothetical protein
MRVTDTPAPTVEERLAAIEAVLFDPPAVEWTDEALAGFREELDRLKADGGHRTRILPPRPLLTPETARELAREYVTILKPGEVLAVRVPDTWTDRQAHETSVRIDEIIALRDLGITVLLLPGEEFAVAQPNTEACE